MLKRLFAIWPQFSWLRKVNISWTSKWKPKHQMKTTRWKKEHSATLRIKSCSARWRNITICLLQFFFQAAWPSEDNQQQPACVDQSGHPVCHYAGEHNLFVACLETFIWLKISCNNHKTFQLLAQHCVLDVALAPCRGVKVAAISFPSSISHSENKGSWDYTIHVQFCQKSNNNSFKII